MIHVSVLLGEIHVIKGIGWHQAKTLELHFGEGIS